MIVRSSGAKGILKLLRFKMDFCATIGGSAAGWFDHLRAVLLQAGANDNFGRKLVASFSVSEVSSQSLIFQDRFILW